MSYFDDRASEKLFIAAMKSLLSLYGKRGQLVFADGTTADATVSPIFSSKLLDVKAASAEVVESGNALVLPDSSLTVSVVPMSTTLHFQNKVYSIAGISEAPGNAIELELVR